MTEQRNNYSAMQVWLHNPDQISFSVWPTDLLDTPMVTISIEYSANNRVEIFTTSLEVLNALLARVTQATKHLEIMHKTREMISII